MWKSPAFPRMAMDAKWKVRVHSPTESFAVLIDAPNAAAAKSQVEERYRKYDVGQNDYGKNGIRGPHKVQAVTEVKA